MRLKQHGLAALVGIGLVLGVLGSAGAAVQYTVMDLGISSGGVGQINNAGQVAGYVGPTNGSYQAFLWSGGQLAMLGTLVGNSAAAALNDQGQAVGAAAAGSANKNQRAVLWQNGTIQDLNASGWPTLTYASGINNAGQIVVGTSTAAYLLDNGVLRNLGFETPGSINNRGQVTGMKNTGEVYSYTPVYHAVVWDNGVVRDLGTLGGKWSQSWDINDAGMVVGTASTPGNPYTGPDTACYWDSTGIHQLPVPTNASQAYGVNNLGVIVGVYDSAGQAHSDAFVYAGGIVTDLNNLIDPSSGWVLLNARDINDQGQIIGTGWFQGQTRYYLLTPVPEPVSILLILPGLLWMRRRVHS